VAQKQLTGLVILSVENDIASVLCQKSWVHSVPEKAEKEFFLVSENFIYTY
jgi:hypothetical protein